MDESEWETWVAHHAALFQLHTDGDVLMFSAWRPLLEHFDVGELLDASDWLVMESPGKNRTAFYRTDHLRQLIRFCQSRRAEAKARLENEPTERTCRVCSDIGLVAVPEPKTLVDGHWTAPWYTATVTCRCPAGLAKYHSMTAYAESKNRRGLRPMTLDHYEAIICPDWRREMRRRDQLRVQVATADAAAIAADAQAAVSGRNFAAVLQRMVRANGNTN